MFLLIRDHLPLWLLLLPMVGALLLISLRDGEAAGVRRILWGNLVSSLALCVWLVAAYEPARPGRPSLDRSAQLELFQFRDHFASVGEKRSHNIESTFPDGRTRTVTVAARHGPDIRLEIGVDGISLWFVVLSVLLIAVAVMRDRNSVPLPSAAWLWLQASLVGTFVALDVVLFVVCWLSSLFSVMWLLGCGGDSSRHEAAPPWLKAQWLGGWLVLLGLGGLVLTFAGLRESSSRPETPLVFAVPELIAGLRHSTAAGSGALLWGHVSPGLFWWLVLGFTWPLLLAPFHRGFVEAILAAPPGLGILLVGVLAKLGVYGWLRFVLPIFPELVREHAGWMTTIIGFSSLLSAALAFGHSDWRSRVALATCSSVGLCLVGLLTQTIAGITGGLLRVFGHGLTAALVMWLLPGRLEVAGGQSVISRDEPRELSQRTDHFRRGAFRFALFAWMGMPGLSGFVPEFLTPLGLVQHDFNAAAFSLMTSGLIAWLWVRAERDLPPLHPSSWSVCEGIVVGGLLLLNVTLGLVPQFVVDDVQSSILAMLPVPSESP